MISLDPSKPKKGLTCNVCKKKIAVAYSIRLCDEHLDEMEAKRQEIVAEHGVWKLTDEEFKLYFGTPDEEQN